MNVFWNLRSGADGPAAVAAVVALGVPRAAIEESLAAAGIHCLFCFHRKRDSFLDCDDVVLNVTEVLEQFASRDRIMGCVAKILAATPFCPSVQRTFCSLFDLCGKTGGIEENPREIALACVCALAVAAGLGLLGCRHIFSTPLPLCVLPAGTEKLPNVGRFSPGTMPAVVTFSGSVLVSALGGTVRESMTGTLRKVGNGSAVYGTMQAALFEPADCRVSHGEGGEEEVLQLETHIDHLTGEEAGLAVEALSAMPEVLDVLWLTGIGKKNRPLSLLRLLCFGTDEEKVAAALFRHTHTLGYRRLFMERRVLARTAIQTAQGWKAKQYVIDGEPFVRVESDVVREEARRCGKGAPAFRLGRQD